MQNPIATFPVFRSCPKSDNFWIREEDIERVRCLQPHCNGDCVEIFATVIKHSKFFFDGLDNITDRDPLQNLIPSMQFSFPNLPLFRERNTDETTVIKPHILRYSTIVQDLRTVSHMWIPEKLAIDPGIVFKAKARIEPYVRSDNSCSYCFYILGDIQPLGIDPFRYEQE